MDEIIKPHSFEDAKNHIQTFSSRTSTSLDITKVDTNEGLFDWFNHKVTGDELNRVTGQVQDYLIRFNSLNSDFINEFGQVYKALESLDQEYIPAILCSVKGAEEASNQAKRAQHDINNTVETLKKVIKVLSDHKEKLDKITHLSKVDEIWNDIVKFQKDVTIINKEITEVKKGLNTAYTKVEELIKYKETLSKKKHLDDIDILWSKVETHNSSINKLSSDTKKSNTDIKKAFILIENNQKKLDLAKSGIDSINKEILEIKRTYDLLNQVVKKIEAIEHLKDIDFMWDSFETYKESFKSLNEVVDKNTNSIAIMDGQIEVLGEFKEKVSQQKHYLDVDTIYDDVIKNSTDITELNAALVEDEKQIEDVQVRTKQNNNKIEVHDSRIETICKEITEINNAHDVLKKIVEDFQLLNHLKDIDSLWDEFESYKMSFANLRASVETNVHSIKEANCQITILSDFKKQVEDQEHYLDIDDIYIDTQKNTIEIEEIQKKLLNHKEEISEIKKQMEQNKEDNLTVKIQLSKKIVIAYAIAGSAVGISILELILNLLGIM